MRIFNFLVSVGYALQGLHFMDPDVVHPMTDALVYDGTTYFLYVRPARIGDPTNKVRIYTSTDITNWILATELELGHDYLGLTVEYRPDHVTGIDESFTGPGHIMIWSYYDGTDIVGGVSNDPLDPLAWRYIPFGNAPNNPIRLSISLFVIMAALEDGTADRHGFDYTEPLIVETMNIQVPAAAMTKLPDGYLHITPCLGYDLDEYGDIMTHTAHPTIIGEPMFVWESAIVVGVLHDRYRSRPQGMLLIPQKWTLVHTERVDAFKEFILVAPECETVELANGVPVDVMCGGNPTELFRVQIESTVTSFVLHLGENSEIEISLTRADSIQITYNGCNADTIGPVTIPDAPELPMNIDIVVDTVAIEILATFGDDSTKHLANMYDCPVPLTSVMLEIEGATGTLTSFPQEEVTPPVHPCTDPVGVQLMLTCAVWEQVPWLGDLLLAIKMPFLLF